MSVRGGTRRRDARAALGVAVVALLVALRALGPFADRFRDHLAPNLQDPLFNLYLLAWGARQWARGLGEFWDAGFYHPEPGVVALSDHLLGPAALTALAGRLGIGPVAVYNLLVLASYPLAALGVFALLRRARVNRSAAAVAGWAFAFAPFRWLHLEHLPVLWMPVLAFVLVAWDRLLERPGPARAAAFAALYATHLAGGLYLAYMIHLPLVVIALVRLPSWRRRWVTARAGGALAGALGLSAVGACLCFAPYLAAVERGYGRTPGEMAIWGGTFASFVVPSRANRYLPEALDHLYRFENALFPGIAVACALLALGLRAAPGALRAAWRARRPPLLAAGAATILVALALGDLATWTDREAVSIAGWSLRIRGYSRPALLLAIGVVLLFLGLGRRRAVSRPFSVGAGLRRALLLQSAAAALLCLPIVAAPAARLLPGLLGIRVPSRFALFALLGAVLLLATGATRLSRRLPIGWRAPGLVAAGALVLLPELLPQPLPWHRIDRPEEIPPVYAELAHRAPGAAVAELPFAVADLRTDLVRMWRSTRSWNPTSAGYSGHEPRFARELRGAAERESGAQLVARLRGLGFRWVILHEHELATGNGAPAYRDFAAAVEATGGRERWRDRDDRLFSLADGGP